MRSLHLKICNKIKQKIYSVLKQAKGFLMFELILAVMFFGLILVAISQVAIWQTEEVNKIAVAEHFDKVLMAATKHFEEELCLKGIKQAITDGQISISDNNMILTATTVDGITGVCGDNMNTLNHFAIDDTLFPEMEFVPAFNRLQQTYYGTIRATADGKPLLVMYSRQRNNKDYTDDRIKRFAPILAGFIGTYAGYVPGTNAALNTNKNIAIGSGRGWTYNLNTAGINNGLNDIKPGNIIGLKVLGERSVFVDINDDHLLHRKDDPNDVFTEEEAIANGWNKMEWNLNMDFNNIENVGNIHFSDQNETDCATAADGTVYYRTEGDKKTLYVCMNHKAQEINTSGNSYSIKDIQLVEANSDSEADLITPPECEDGNGNPIEATAFIAPTVMSSGELSLEESTAGKVVGDSIIAVKTWIERTGGKWRPRMETLTITNKKVHPTGPYAKILVMSICPRTDNT